MVPLPVPANLLQTKMEEIFRMSPFILTPLLSLIFLWFINRIFLKPSTKSKRPPSPSKLPIIGNLHQLSSLPHHEFHSLAKKHGPIMLLHFGSVPVLIISSADLASEVMRTHDLIFASRPVYKAPKKITYGCKDVAFSPYGENWRQLKSIVVLQLVSSKRVQSFRSIREEETALFVSKVREYSSGVVDLSAMLVKYANDGVGRAAFGRKYSDSENGKKFLSLMNDLMEVMGAINIGDFIPWLAWTSRVNGFDKKVDKIAEDLNQILETLIEDRQKIIQKEQQDVEEKSTGQDFLDILLQIYNDKTADASIDRDSMKALLLDVFVGGTDTTSTTLEWVMSELLRHPAVLEKLQSEVRGIVKEKQDITDDDLEKMHYLKAVIKESLRCHPPLPLLVPRVATNDVQVKGYDVAAGTLVMINMWSIGRDPVSWYEPEKFMPERFLNSSIDYKGLDFELIPFGAGRRGCPGITFAVATMELLLANLVHKFNWKLANGVKPKDFDMRESPGLTVNRAVPLLAVASPITK